MNRKIQKKLIITVIVLYIILFLAGINGVFAQVEHNTDNCEIGGSCSHLITAGRTHKAIDQVYLGGYPLGITINGEGVVVIGLHEFVGINGEICCPAMKSGLQINDKIIELDGKKIFGSAKLSEIALASNGRQMSVVFIRDDNLYNTKIQPQVDLSTGCYKLGLWTKDVSSGVGTLTYTKMDLSFGALGHPICNGNGNIIDCSNGGIFPCSIEGVLRGQRGAAGELKGTFSFENRIGNVYSNNKFGTFGKFTTHNKYCETIIDVADICDVHPGKASIYCTIIGNNRKKYDIEIIKAASQKSPDDKGMVIHITDKQLLEKCGGIVQGMSGSPIVQDGRLVGAVTHVFVNDPTRGYGIYAKWMLNN